MKFFVFCSSVLTTAVFLSGSPAQSQEPYKIGVSEPMSGAASALGIPVVEGIRLAADSINRNGGVDGHPIELLIRDDQSKPDVAVQNFRGLAEEGVYAIIGPNQGSNTLAVASIASGKKIPLCAFNNTLSITHIDNPYIFRCQSTDKDNIKAAFQFVKNTLMLGSVGVLYTGDAYGTDAYNAMSSIAAEVGIEIKGAQKISYGGTDTTAEWTKLLAAKPATILMWGSGSVMSVAMRNGMQLGSTLPVIAAQGAAAPDIIKGAGAAAEGTYFLTLNAPDQVTAEQKVLSDALKKKDGPDAQLYPYNTIGWDAVYIFAKALEYAKGDKTKMVESLEKIRNLKLASGNYSFEPDNHDGLRSDSVWVVQVRGGRMYGVKRGFQE